MSVQNRLIRVAGGLLITLSLLSCSPSENDGSKSPNAIVICLTISPGSPDTYKYSPKNPTNVTITPPPPVAGSDKIGLDQTTGEIDLSRLNVAAGSGPDPSRHVAITYSFEPPCPANAQYSFYFTHAHFPLRPRKFDHYRQIEHVHVFQDRATSVTVDYENDPREKSFKFYISYTVVKTATGVVVKNDRTPDPNIINTPAH